MHPKSRPSPDTHELAWAAGFFDGEGCTCITRYTPKNQNKQATVLNVSLSQTDPEPLERFKRAVRGLGVVNGPHLPPSRAVGNKPQWKYRASGFERVQAIIAMLWPWLSTVKREQAKAALLIMRKEYRRPGAPTQDYCKRGHDLGVVGRVVRNGERRCLRCEQLRSLAGYYRRKGDQEEAQRVLDGTHVSRKGWRRTDRGL